MGIMDELSRLQATSAELGRQLGEVRNRLAASDAELRRQLTDFRVELGEYQTSVERQNDESFRALQQELDTWRVMSRLNRATWFEVMTWLIFGGVLFSDLARGYARNGWWSLLLPLAQHGAGGRWEWSARTVGVAWEAAFVVWMTRRAQVPAELEWYVAHGAITIKEYLAKYGDRQSPSRPAETPGR